MTQPYGVAGVRPITAGATGFAASLLETARFVVVPPGALVDHAARVLESTRTAQAEGIVCKRLTFRYQPGVRSRDWVKIRNTQTADVTVGGWVRGGGGWPARPGPSS